MQTLLAACLLVSLAGGCQKSEPKSDPVGSAEAKPEHKAEALASLTVDEVEAQLAAHRITAVDCNDDELRKQFGVVPGAILISEYETFAASELPADKSTKLVFYCHDES